MVGTLTWHSGGSIFPATVEAGYSRPLPLRGPDALGLPVASPSSSPDSSPSSSPSSSSSSPASSPSAVVCDPVEGVQPSDAPVCTFRETAAVHRSVVFGLALGVFLLAASVVLVIPVIRGGR